MNVPTYTVRYIGGRFDGEGGPSNDDQVPAEVALPANARDRDAKPGEWDHYRLTESTPEQVTYTYTRTTWPDNTRDGTP
jgi:hypothetical protein